MAAVYLAIAAGVTSIEPTEEMSLVAFGVGAASIFLIGAALLLAVDNRVLWAVGAAMQLMIGAMYVAVSTDRAPTFEVWGITLRVLQIPLFALLVVLAVRSARPAGLGADSTDNSSSTMPSPESSTSAAGSPHARVG